MARTPLNNVRARPDPSATSSGCFDATGVLDQATVADRRSGALRRGLRKRGAAGEVADANAAGPGAGTGGRVSKHTESRNGADWEWHIVGHRRTLKMRVQAKRVQRNEVLKIAHEVKSSGEQQRKLLIDGATDARMKPVYCIYCTEGQRKFWKQDKALSGFEGFETGCLLAGAENVPQDTKSLVEIEKKCRPWHYLFLPGALMPAEARYVEADAEDPVEFAPLRQTRSQTVAIAGLGESADIPAWNAPTVDDLNEDRDREFDWIGVGDTTEEDRARLEPDTRTGREMARWDEERLRELRLSRMLVMDVRGDPESDERD